MIILPWLYALYMRIRTWNRIRIHNRKISKIQNTTLPNHFIHNFENIFQSRYMLFMKKLDTFMSFQQKSIQNQIRFISSEYDSIIRDCYTTNINLSQIYSDVSEKSSNTIHTIKNQYINQIELQTVKYMDTFHLHMKKSLDAHSQNVNSMITQLHENIDDLQKESGHLEINLKKESDALDTILSFLVQNKNKNIIPLQQHNKNTISVY